MLPQARSHELTEKTLAVEHLFRLRRRPLGCLRVEIGLDCVIVMKLDAVEAKLPVLPNLGGEGHFFPGRRAERIAAGADIPRTEGEAVGPLF